MSLGFTGLIAFFILATQRAVLSSLRLMRPKFTLMKKKVWSRRGHCRSARAGARIVNRKLTYDRDKQQFIVPGKLSLTENNGETLSAANTIIDNELEKGRFNDCAWKPNQWAHAGRKRRARRYFAGA